ncbi:MAG: RNA polymerase sigma factor, partial [Gallionella sp.]
RYAGELGRYLRARRGAEDAEDIVQEGFVRLLQNSATQAPENSRAWLYRTCTNLTYDANDYRSVRENVHVECDNLDELEDNCADAARHIEGKQQLRQVWLALHSLPEACRHTFLLNRLDGLSQREIATHLGLSEKTVERYIQRALEVCRATLEK